MIISQGLTGDLDSLQIELHKEDDKDFFHTSTLSQRRELSVDW
jgi:hypothetical protein